MSLGIRPLNRDLKENAGEPREHCGDGHSRQRHSKVKGPTLNGVWNKEAGVVKAG